MTYRVEPVEGTELVAVYDGDEQVLHPCPPAEAAEWIEAQTKPRAAQADEPEEADEPDEFEPQGVL